MTSSGKNGLNIRTNGTAPGVRRSMRPRPHPLQCSMETSQNLVTRSKSVMRSSSVISSQIGVMYDQLRISLYMVMSKNVM